MARRYRDWLAQAHRDIKAAQDSLANGNYEWAAFQAQQAAEKALKALLRYHNFAMTGHTLVYLLRQARDFVDVPEGMMTLARELDRHYIQPRYPNGFAAGYPGEYYDEATAARCVDYGEQIIRFAEQNIS